MISGVLLLYRYGSPISVSEFRMYVGYLEFTRPCACDLCRTYNIVDARLGRMGYCVLVFCTTTYIVGLVC